MPGTLTEYLNEQLTQAGLNVVRPVVTPHRTFPQIVVEWAGFDPRSQRDSGELRSICSVIVAIGYVTDDGADMHVEVERAALRVGRALLTVPGLVSITPQGPPFALTDPQLAEGVQVMYRAIRFRVEAAGVFDGDSA